MNTILLEFLREGLIKSTNKVEFIENMNPTQVYRKFQSADDNTMWLVTNTNESPEVSFERCLSAILKQVKTWLTNDEALQVHLNLDRTTVKQGTIVLNGEVLVRVLNLQPDFTQIRKG